VAWHHKPVLLAVHRMTMTRHAKGRLARAQSLAARLLGDAGRASG
jgi:hypothetical protein